MLMASVVLAADFDMFMLRALAAAISPLGRKLCIVVWVLNPWISWVFKETVIFSVCF